MILAFPKNMSWTVFMCIIWRYLGYYYPLLWPTLVISNSDDRCVMKRYLCTWQCCCLCHQNVIWCNAVQTRQQCQANPHSHYYCEACQHTGWHCPAPALRPRVHKHTGPVQGFLTIQPTIVFSPTNTALRSVLASGRLAKVNVGFSSNSFGPSHARDFSPWRRMRRLERVKLWLRWPELAATSARWK